MPRMLFSQLLAQVHEDAPVSPYRIAAALALDLPDVIAGLEALERRHQVRPVLVIGSRTVHYETTTAGAFEATGGAQMSLAPRPLVAVQPALF